MSLRNWHRPFNCLWSKPIHVKSAACISSSIWVISSLRERIIVPLDWQPGHLKFTQPGLPRLPYFVYTGCRCRRGCWCRRGETSTSSTPTRNFFNFSINTSHRGRRWSAGLVYDYTLPISPNSHMAIFYRLPLSLCHGRVRLCLRIVMKALSFFPDIQTYQVLELFKK